VTETLLDIHDLKINFDVYQGKSHVINGINMSIDKGETVALVGETGCGKSVTASSILGLLPPAANVPEGHILYKGEDLLTLSEDEKHRYRGQEISMIMQDPMTALNPIIEVGEQMMDVMKWRGKRNIRIRDWVVDKFRDHSDLREDAIRMLEKVQIPSPERVFSSYPIELSGGMRQRVLIAIALLSEPDLLIADEPGTAIDVTTESTILELLDDMIDETGTSVLYITHDLGVAAEVADNINVMYAGDIVEKSRSEVLFESPKHPYTRGLLESIPKLTGTIGEGIEGELPDYTDPPQACRFAARCPYKEDECEEIYPHHRLLDDDSSVACHLYDGKIESGVSYSERIDIGKAPWQREEQTTISEESK